MSSEEFARRRQRIFAESVKVKARGSRDGILVAHHLSQLGGVLFVRKC